MHELKQKLAELQDQPCLSMLAGDGTGSHVHIEFGDPVPRDRPLQNRGVPLEERLYEGTYDLFIECAWRLEQQAVVVCGSTDDNRHDGPMLRGLALLVGRRVQTLVLAEPVPDLTLHFDDELILRLFCDQTDMEDEADKYGDNYSLRVRDEIFSVGARGHLSRHTVERKIHPSLLN